MLKIYKCRNVVATTFSWLLMLSALFFNDIASGQNISVVASVDTANITIGDHIKLKLTAKHDNNVNVNFPFIPDTISKLEIFNRTVIDTLKSTDQDKQITQTQTLFLTCYDSGYYAIPAFQFVYNIKGDTAKYFAETDPILVSVTGVHVNIDEDFKDIKKPLSVPFDWREAIPYIIGLVLLGALIYGIIYFLQKRKKQELPVREKILLRPAHEIALEELHALEKEKLWQQGKVKAYHSRLTDIVRTYIEHRFKIIAMELTTGEILDQLTNENISKLEEEKLKSLLELADLVKFAKANPLPDENGMSMALAFDFVRNTIEKQITEETITTNEN